MEKNEFRHLSDMRQLITLILILYGSLSFSQNKSQFFRFSSISNESCDTVSNLFKEDLSYNNLYLFIIGGPAPTIYETDQDFYKQFKVSYYDFGCIVPTSNECLKEYNYLVFAHLSEKHGEKWLKKVRKDVLGVKEWKKNKP